ncbi:MAG: MerR family transcriptional regulator [Xenococcaceae cyanobacterium MO_188.B29]|nr:MerR family transcriptional regulator [Xenococcaceae cyanobacterium MO_188.B29]
MEDKLTIAEVASLSGLSVHTLRYYERAGLLEAIGRDEKGHRRYSAENVQQIQFLNRLRATGMSIRQMQQFIGLFRQKPNAVRERRLMLEQHQQQVEEHILQLKEHLEVINWKIQHYKKLEAEQKNEFDLLNTKQEKIDEN